MNSRLLVSLTLSVICLISVSVNLTGQPSASQARQNTYITSQEGEKIAAANRDGYAAFRKRDLRAAAAAFERAYAVNPQDDLTIDFIAETYALVGDKQAALEWLRKLIELNPCFFHLPESAIAIIDSDEYRALARIAATKEQPAHRSEIAFTVPERDLIPEGIAYDPVGKAFFLSSLYKRKIIRVKPSSSGRPALIEDFTTEGQDGLYCTLGMKVDANRRVLWACSSAEPMMKGYSKNDEGRAVLFKYDLVSRKLLKKFSLGPNPHHLLNDLVINSSGDVFVTDTVSGEIYTVAQGRGELEILVPAGKLEAPNGIAISDNNQKLFVSDIVQGVYVIDLKTKRLTRLGQPVGISPNGSDGLYFYQNSLIGVLNIVSERAGRVSRFYLDQSLKGITRSEVIDCNNPLYQLPTTGVIAGNWFYYIANSQYRSFNRDRTIFPQDKLRDVIILRTKL